MSTGFQNLPLLALTALLVGCGGEHTWPGGDGWALGGTQNKDVNASQMILDFFSRYRLP